MHLPIYVALILLYLPTADVWLQGETIKYLLIASLVMMGLMIPVCILNVVVSIKSAVKEGKDPTKHTMVMKLCLIPWYGFNFYLGFVFSSLFFNPFTLILIPIVVALLCGATYALMICTSIGDIAYFINKDTQKKGAVNASTKFAIVLLFIFCLDVIGAIILYKKSKKAASIAQEEALALPQVEPLAEEKTESEEHK